MNANIHTNALINFTVIQDGEVIDAPSHDAADLLQDIAGRIQLQVTMFWYDLVHRTHYRKVRNDLVREKRNKEFEARIGIVAR